MQDKLTYVEATEKQNSYNWIAANENAFLKSPGYSFFQSPWLDNDILAFLPDV